MKKTISILGLFAAAFCHGVQFVTPAAMSNFVNNAVNNAVSIDALVDIMGEEAVSNAIASRTEYDTNGVFTTYALVNNNNSYSVKKSKTQISVFETYKQYGGAVVSYSNVDGVTNGMTLVCCGDNGLTLYNGKSVAMPMTATASNTFKIVSCIGNTPITSVEVGAGEIMRVFSLEQKPYTNEVVKITPISFTTNVTACCETNFYTLISNGTTNFCTNVVTSVTNIYPSAFATNVTYETKYNDEIVGGFLLTPVRLTETEAFNITGTRSLYSPSTNSCWVNGLQQERENVCFTATKIQALSANRPMLLGAGSVDIVNIVPTRTLPDAKMVAFPDETDENGDIWRYKHNPWYTEADWNNEANWYSGIDNIVVTYNDSHTETMAMNNALFKKLTLGALYNAGWSWIPYPYDNPKTKVSNPCKAGYHSWGADCKCTKTGCDAKREHHFADLGDYTCSRCDNHLTRVSIDASGNYKTTTLDDVCNAVDKTSVENHKGWHHKDVGDTTMQTACACECGYYGGTEIIPHILCDYEPKEYKKCDDENKENYHKLLKYCSRHVESHKQDDFYVLEAHKAKKEKDKKGTYEDELSHTISGGTCEYCGETLQEYSEAHYYDNDNNCICGGCDEEVHDWGGVFNGSEINDCPCELHSGLGSSCSHTCSFGSGTVTECTWCHHCGRLYRTCEGEVEHGGWKQSKVKSSMHYCSCGDVEDNWEEHDYGDLGVCKKCGAKCSTGGGSLDSDDTETTETGGGEGTGSGSLTGGKKGMSVFVSNPSNHPNNPDGPIDEVPKNGGGDDDDDDNDEGEEEQDMGLDEDGEGDNEAGRNNTGHSNKYGLLIGAQGGAVINLYVKMPFSSSRSRR